MVVAPSSGTWRNDNARESCINFESITTGSVTAPRNIPDEAPGLHEIQNTHNSISQKKTLTKLYQRSFTYKRKRPTQNSIFKCNWKFEICKWNFPTVSQETNRRETKFELWPGFEERKGRGRGGIILGADLDEESGEGEERESDAVKEEREREREENETDEQNHHHSLPVQYLRRRHCSPKKNSLSKF